MEEDNEIKSSNLLEDNSSTLSEIKNLDDSSNKIIDNEVIEKLSEVNENDIIKMDANTTTVDSNIDKEISNNENDNDLEVKDDDDNDDDENDDENDDLHELMREKMGALLNQSLAPKTPEKKFIRPIKIKREKPQQEYYGLDIKKLRQWIREQETENLKKEQVRWRDKKGSRPWLAGMVKKKMCALIHAEELVKLLNQGMDILG